MGAWSGADQTSRCRLTSAAVHFHEGLNNGLVKQHTLVSKRPSKQLLELAAKWSSFTLIELLVVISVILVLAAMVLPALARAREKAKAAICLSNLRQWGYATQLYALNNDDYLPPEGFPNPGPGPLRQGWYVQLPAVLGLPPYDTMPWRTNPSISPGNSIWICPSNKRRSNGRNLFHYCLNGNVDGTGEEDRPMKISWIREPSRLVWLFDSKNQPAVGSWNFAHTNLHGRGAQILFVDGHAKWFGAYRIRDPVTGRPPESELELTWFPY